MTSKTITSTAVKEVIEKIGKKLGETIISELVTLAKLESEKLNNLINDCGAYGRIKPSNLLREFISYFEQRMFKTETVSDFRNGVQLIKRR